MADSADLNAAIWKSDEIVAAWSAERPQRERPRDPHRQFLNVLVPFAPEDAFTFLDLGAGTGAAAREILRFYPNSSAVLADFSPQMMQAGDAEMASLRDRYRYVEYDASVAQWPSDLANFDLIVSSLFVHHLPDERKYRLFAEICAHLVAGGWYFNYDVVRAADPIVENSWQRVNDRLDPEAAAARVPQTEVEHARWLNHMRYVAPLSPQLEALGQAGFSGVDVYWKQLEHVIYGGCRPA